MKRSQILPVILRSDRPTKEVIIGRGKHGGYDLHICFAKFKDGAECGWVSKDVEYEREGHLCWIHFTDLRAMELFAKLIVASWAKFTAEEKDNDIEQEET